MRFSILLVLFLAISQNIHAAKDISKLQISSTVIKNGQMLLPKFTCLENDINPPLEFKDIPAKTKTLAVTLVSPDAPEGSWVHWVLYNIDAKTTAFKEGLSFGTPLFNDFGKFSYNGPCPADDKEHHFVFTVYALNSNLEIIEGGILKDLEKAMKGRILAQSSLTVSFRKPEQ